MAESRGRLGTLDVGVGNDLVGGVVSINGNWAYDEIDTTDFDDAGDKSNEYGERQFVVTGQINLDEADVGQAALQAAFEGATKIPTRYRPGVGVGRKQYVFSGMIASFEIVNERNAIVTASFEIRSSGTVDTTAQ